MPILPVPGGGGATSHSTYYGGTNLGEYQFVSLQEIIENFTAAYVGEGKILESVLKGDVNFHAHRALQELHYDTLVSSKAQEIEVCPSLKMPLPHDYVNYVKLASVDGQGIEHVLYPASKTSNPFAILQDDDCGYLFGDVDCGSGAVISGCTNSEAPNYNENATIDDGTCIDETEALLNGCTNLLAANYNAGANLDDGSCFFSGCTDVDATNWSSVASIDDGSCEYGDGQDGSCDQRTMVDPQRLYTTSNGESSLQYDAGSSLPLADTVHYLLSALLAAGQRDLRFDRCKYRASQAAHDATYTSKAGVCETGKEYVFAQSDGPQIRVVVGGEISGLTWNGSWNGLMLHLQGIGLTGITTTTDLDQLQTLMREQWNSTTGMSESANYIFTSGTRSGCYCGKNKPEPETERLQKVKLNTKIKSARNRKGSFANRAANSQNSPVSTNLSEQCMSDSWANYSGSGSYSNTNTDSTTTTVGNFGQRYGIDPQYAQMNGSFFMDHVKGNIHFNSALAGKTVVLKYISDGHGTDDEMIVPKMAEEAMYKWIAYGCLSARKDSPEYLIARFKKEKFAETRKAKIRLSNIKIEEISQVFRGKSKWIKH